MLLLGEIRIKMLSLPRIYIVYGFLLLALSSAIGYHYVVVDNLEKDVLRLKNDLILAMSDSASCQKAIDLQNLAIQGLSADYDKAKNELDEWKRKPPQVKYKTIYKRIPVEVNATRSDCKDIKGILNAVKEMEINLW